MKLPFQKKPTSPTIKGRPDYYITPTRDFTKYTRDCEAKYWSKENAFDWQQSVPENLRAHLQGLDPAGFTRIALLTLPLIERSVQDTIARIQRAHLPLEEDVLKHISECIPFDKTAIHDASQILAPLEELEHAVAQGEDQLDIIEGEVVDLQEQQRLGMIRTGVTVKAVQHDAERQEQARELARLKGRRERTQKALRQARATLDEEKARLRSRLSRELQAVEKQVLADLNDTLGLLRQTLRSGNLPQDTPATDRLKDLILKRQLRGLKDIANHALVVEQSAIAPLTMGIIHYKRHREIQEAMTTFINDEAKHSATFRRYLADKLDAKEFISDLLIKGADRFMWVSRFFPGAGLFLAVIVEAIGAATLEFFGEEEYMPDPLFRSICQTISQQDETRHMDLCVDMYNELFRSGRRWERLRNHVALRVIMKAVYGDKTKDHHLIQAFQAFGVEADLLYRHVVDRLSQQLARISMYIEPEALMKIAVPRR